MLLTLIFLPFAGAIISWFIVSDHLRRRFLLSIAFIELLLAISCWIWEPASFHGDLLYQDSMGRLVLSLTCLLFFAAAIYAQGYLQTEKKEKRKDFERSFYFVNAPETTFTACLLLFLSAATLAASTRHFGLLWVGIEATTLASAPLIYFHRHSRSLEATWKYLMICSVGIGLALLGNFLLDISMQTESGQGAGMTLTAYMNEAANAHPGWFKAAFVFLLIGYGTKMGIAPMHTWLPDAHSEAPSLVSALLSGALLNCAFLGIYRTTQVSIAVGLAEFSSTLLLAFGALSLLVAGLFIVGQTDYKRMLAYSSIEHMGILLLGIGLGLTAGVSTETIPHTIASRGWVLHMVCHSLIKGALFFTAGNILAKYHTKSASDITGLQKIVPITAILWMSGIIAIVGAPPFGLFISEFSILQILLEKDFFIITFFYLLMLGIIFVGMITPALQMYKGTPPYGIRPQPTESFFSITPSACLLIAALIVGLFTPNWLASALDTAAATVAIKP